MKTVPITIFYFFFLGLFHIPALLGYDVTDPNAFSLTTNFSNVGSDTEGRAYAIALTPEKAQSYLHLLNAVCTKSDVHHLYTGVMVNVPPFYPQHTPIDPIQKNVDYSSFPPSSSYSLTGTNPNLPAIGMTITRAARWINWYNNGQSQDPNSTESGTYTISENATNPVPPAAPGGGPYSGAWAAVMLDSNGISRVITSDHIARVANPAKPPLTMVFLALEPVLAEFHNDTSEAYVPMGSDDMSSSFSYFWEWTYTFNLDANNKPSGNRMPSSYYGEYEVLQGTTPQGKFPFGSNDNFYYATGFRLMKVTFPTETYSTDMPAGPPLPLQIFQ